MVAVVIHDVGCGDESGHIATGFAWQEVIDGPVVGIFSPSGSEQSLRDGVFPAVVSGDCESPVAEALIEVAEVVCGSIAGLDGVSSFIDERIDLESVVFTRCKHELPKSDSPRV